MRSSTKPAVTWARRLFAASLLAKCTAHAQAPAVNINYLEGLLPTAPDAIATYGPDMFGDKASLFSGVLEFQHTDLSLPGNSGLDVALRRKHTAGRSPYVRGQLGDWDLETPRIEGTFATQMGWVTGSSGTNRCTGFSAPPLAQPQGILASNYWSGTHLNVPGQGAQEVLLRSANFPAAPADGRSYPLVTHQNWQVGCLATIQNGAGEGFFAVSPAGVRYRFDWMAQRQQLSVKSSKLSAARQDMYLMATEATDRFGNWLHYVYDPATP